MLSVLDYLGSLALVLAGAAAMFTVWKTSRVVRAKRNLASALRQRQVSEGAIAGILDDLRELEEKDPGTALRFIRSNPHPNQLFEAIGQLPEALALEALSALVQPSDRGRERYLRDMLDSHPVAQLAE